MKAKKLNNMIWSAALALICLTAISMCAVSGTFAKYSSSASGESEAVVASWDAEVTGVALTETGITAGISAYSESEYASYGITGSAPDSHGYVMSGYRFTVTTGTATETTGRVNVAVKLSRNGTEEWPEGMKAAIYSVSGEAGSEVYTFISENATGAFNNVTTVAKDTSFTGNYLVCFKAAGATAADSYQVTVTAVMEQVD